MSPLSLERARTLLGVGAAVSRADLRRAYRAAARRLHPDALRHAPTPAETTVMAQVNVAYAALLADLGARPPAAPPPPASPAARPPDAVIDTSDLLPRKKIRGVWSLPGQPPAPRPPRVPRPSRPLAAVGVPPPVEVRFEPVPIAPAPAPGRTRLPFGRYEGSTVAEVGAADRPYLEWVVRTVRAHPEVVAAARAFLARTEAGETPPTRRP